MAPVRKHLAAPVSKTGSASPRWEHYRRLPPPSTRTWIHPTDYAVDIQHDGTGEFFELRLPTHLSDSLNVSVMQSELKRRHLLLVVRQSGNDAKLDRFLCGLDEREWFVAAVPGGASSVRQAMDALQPQDVRAALARHQVSSRKRYARKNRAFHRQGEWFFIPALELNPDPKLILQRDAAVYARGQIRHPDHRTITLPHWHRVMMNTETQSRTMANVAFLD